MQEPKEQPLAGCVTRSLHTPWLLVAVLVAVASLFCFRTVSTELDANRSVIYSRRNE